MIGGFVRLVQNVSFSNYDSIEYLLEKKNGMDNFAREFDLRE